MVAPISRFEHCLLPDHATIRKVPESTTPIAMVTAATVNLLNGNILSIARLTSFSIGWFFGSKVIQYLKKENKLTSTHYNYFTTSLFQFLKFEDIQPLVKLNKNFNKNNWNLFFNLACVLSSKSHLDTRDYTSLACIHSFLTISGISTPLFPCTNIKSLEIDHALIDLPFSYPRETHLLLRINRKTSSLIKHFQLNFFCHNANKQIESLSSLKKLKHLKISSTSYSNVFEHLSQLSGLKKLEYKGFLDKTGTCSIAKCISIQELCFTHIDEDAVFHLSHLPSLRTLRTTSFNDNCLRQISTHCPFLETIEFRDSRLHGHVFSVLNLTHFSYLNALTTLRNLDLTLSTDCFITSSELEILKNTLSSLTSLVINIPMIPDSFERKSDN